MIVHFYFTDVRPGPGVTRLYWSTTGNKHAPDIPYCGIPFVFVARQVLGCHQGRDANQKKKEQYKEAVQKKIGM